MSTQPALMLDRKRAESIEAVALHPQVGVGQAYAAMASLGDLFVERVRGDEPTRERHRSGTVARREPCPCRLSEHALGRSGQPRDVRRSHPHACGQGMNVPIHQARLRRWRARDR